MKLQRTSKRARRASYPMRTCFAVLFGTMFIAAGWSFFELCSSKSGNLSWAESYFYDHYYFPDPEKKGYHVVTEKTQEHHVLIGATETKKYSLLPALSADRKTENANPANFDDNENRKEQIKSKKEVPTLTDKKYDEEEKTQRGKNEIDNDDMVIFYNIFIPNDKNNNNNILQPSEQLAIDIIKEQLEMIYNASRVTVSTDRTEKVGKMKRNVILYYNTLGGHPGNLERETNATENGNTDGDRHLGNEKNSSTKATLTRKAGYVIVNELIQTICSDYQWTVCKHLAHYSGGGDESVTLTRLHEYCRLRHHPADEINDDGINERTTGESGSRETEFHPSGNDVVIYLHNKGSFHYTLRNTLWRQALTAAALHPDCFLSSKSPNDLTSTSSCNACGLSFEPTWSTIFVGNMWTARCDYIQKLVSPRVEFKDYTANRNRTDDNAKVDSRSMTSPSSWLSYNYLYRRYDIAEWARGRRVSRPSNVPRSTFKNKDKLRFVNFTYHLYPELHEYPDFWALGRYATEHWVGSHPDLIPCDLSTKHFRAWMKVPYWNFNFSWSLAPRGSLFSTPPRYLAKVPGDMIVKVIQEQSIPRRDEFVLVAGSLYRWIALYNQTPPSSSWVWSFFPDAEYWQEQIPMLRSHIIPYFSSLSPSTS